MKKESEKYVLFKTPRTLQCTSCDVGIVLCLLALPAVLFAQDELIIISPHPEGTETEFGSNFEKWYEEQTGRTVKTDWRDVGGTSSNYRFIESEFKRVPEGIGVDIFFGGGTDNYLRLSNNGWLNAYKLPEAQLEQMTQSFKGSRSMTPNISGTVRRYRVSASCTMKSCVK